MEQDKILKQVYLTPSDLQKIIPGLTYHRALTYINEIRKTMQEKNYFVPEGRKKVALTKLVKEKFGI